MSESKYLKMDELKHGYVYLMVSRNGFAGVWDKDTRGFVFIREKFGSEYLFTEYHWDTGPPYGTVHPYTEFEKCPLEDIRQERRDEETDVWVDNTPLFNYLKSIEDRAWKAYQDFCEKRNEEYEREQEKRHSDLE